MVSADDKAKQGGKDGVGPDGKMQKIKDPNQAHETLDIAKNVPQARFGHTITMVNKYKVVLFGGATGDTGKYSMTGETFIFNMLLRTWTELNGKYDIFYFSFLYYSQRSTSFSKSCPRINQRRANANGRLRWRNRRWQSRQ
jgi:hypothetical protein